jgi:diadenosine tetraphosphate (Ap4A) HIT family hydrolase
VTDRRRAWHPVPRGLTLALLWIAALARPAFAEDGFRLIVNCNKHGGQVVYHLHMHLVGGAMLGPMLSGGKHG